MPELLGEMRHHRPGKANRRFDSLAQDEAGRVAVAGGIDLFEPIRKLANPRDAAVEAELVEIVGDVANGAMDGATNLAELALELYWRCGVGRRQRDGRFGNEAIEAIDIAPCAF